MNKFKCYYIYHSCFVVESAKSLLIFDFYKFPKKSVQDDISLEDIILNSEKNIYVFSSHGHYDHFNSDILKWKNRFSNLKYIFSSDIKLSEENPNTYFMNENEILLLDDLIIRSYGSSDLGISFLIEIDSTKIFHAGDLNWWYWKDDTKEEELYMKNLFSSIVQNIEVNKEIDLAFFPVDPRLEEFCYLGVKYFAEKVKPKNILGMHFDNNYFVTKDLILELVKFNVNSFEIERTNSVFDF
ncbi:MAG: MBL fold metallo-hydrolase [Cetobacterium sp.]